MPAIDVIYESCCTSRFPVPNPRAVAEYEAAIGSPLPATYRDFILRYNGGLFEGIRYPVEGEPADDQQSFNVLFGLGAGREFAELAGQEHSFDDNCPAVMLPVGYTQTGQMLLMFIGGAQDGNIFFKRPGSWDLSRLADDIYGLFEIITPVPE